MDYLQLADFHEKFLTCDICAELYKRPRILLCHHTFCQDCLEKWAKANEDKELTCPNCRNPWQVPVGGVEKLHANYHIIGLIDYISENQKEGEESKVTSSKRCSICKIKAATRACEECSQIYCDDCARHAHTGIKLGIRHHVIDMDEYLEMQAKIRPAMCDQHPNSKINYYCETCSEPSCPDCLIAIHKKNGHSHRQLSDIAASTRILIKEDLAKVTRKLKYYDDVEAGVDATKKELTDSKELAISEIKKHTEKLITKMRKNEEKMLRNLDDTYEDKIKSMDSQLDDIQQVKSQMKISFEYSKNLVDIGNDAGLMSVQQKTRKELENFLNDTIEVDSQINHLQYFPDPNFASGQQGYLNENLAVASNSLVTTGSPYATVNKEVTYQLLTNDMRGARVRHGRAKVKANVTLKKEEKVACEVRDNNNGTYGISFKPNYKNGAYFLSVSVFDQPVKDDPLRIMPIPLLPLKRVKMVGSIGKKVSQFNYSLGIAVSKMSEIFVADRENLRVQVFDISGLYQTYFRIKLDADWISGGVGVKPWDLAFNKNNNLVITDHSSRQVLECDTVGKLVRKFGEKELKDPRGIAVSSNGNIHVTDWEQDRVVVFTPEGRVVKKIGGRGENPGYFKYPRSIAINSLDQIIVSDCNNNRVQVFDSDGDFLFECGKKTGKIEEELWNPAGVTVDSYDNIIVCDCNNHRLVMFDSEGKYMCRVDDPRDKFKYPLAITAIHYHPFQCVVTEENNFSIIQAD